MNQVDLSPNQWDRVLDYVECAACELDDDPTMDFEGLVELALTQQPCEDCLATEEWMLKLGISQFVQDAMAATVLGDTGPLHDHEVFKGIKYQDRDGNWQYGDDS